MNGKLLVSAALAGLYVFSLPAGNPVRNGSFEESGGSGVPAGWSFFRRNEAPVTVFSTAPGVDGEKCLRIVSRMTGKTPHRFGVLTQLVPLQPERNYTFSFAARGRNVVSAVWTFGKDWRIRIPVTGVTGEWKNFRFPLRIPAGQLEGAGSCGIRLIVEGVCSELDIDDVKILPGKSQLVMNGDFLGEAGKLPPGWAFRISRKAEVNFAVDDEGDSLRIVNATARKPNVYGALSQTVKLLPEIDYVLRVRARGSGQGIAVAVGTKWNHRLQIQPLGQEWRDYELTFRPKADEVGKDRSAPLVIISESLTQGVWIDRISLEPKVRPNLPQAAWQERGIYRVDRLAGNFDSLKSIPPGLPAMTLPFSGNKKDLAAKIAFASDGEGVIFLADVTGAPGRAGNIRDLNRLQLRLDRGAHDSASPGETALEVGFSLEKEGGAYRLRCRAGRDASAGELPEHQVRTHGSHTPSGYFLAARFSWELLGEVREKRRFRFSVATGGSDAPAARYVQALFGDDSPALWVTFPSEPVAEQLKGTLLLANATGDVRIEAELTDSAGKRISREIATVPGVAEGELVQLPLTLALGGLACGDFTVGFKVNGKTAERHAGTRIDLYEQQKKVVAGFRTELERLKKEFAAHYNGRPYSEYVSAPLNILDHHLPLLQKRLEQARSDGERNYYAAQAAMTRQEITETLSELAGQLAFLRNGGRLPVAWKLESGRISLENGWPVASAVSENNEKTRRPMIFAGYGHFSDIDRDIAQFPGIGANVVQVEIGPHHIFTREGTGNEFEITGSLLKSRLLPLLKEAHGNNVKISLLISPHYCPVWLLKKYPDMAASSGFLRYEVTHPKAREMMRCYISALFRELKTGAGPYLDALHSICLSNEPSYANCHPDNPYSAAKFREHMERKYGSAAAFNRIAGSNFTDYDEMLRSISKGNPAARYEFYMFSRETFAGWHRMLAEAVKRELPSMPVHTKIMVFSSPFEYVSGVDPELMSDFSDYNGNDNYFFQRGRFVADWNVSAMTHEMQISAGHASVANTENHIIPDRETRPVPNGHIYTANFQQFVTGASTLITWVWADIDYDFARKHPRHDLLGNIFLRPGNLAAHAKSGLDGVRLAPELRKFFDYEPEIAILYSPTSMILSPGSYRGEVDRLYTALCFTGYRVRFLSERQLAKGEFGKVKLLYVAGAGNISLSALDGMERFVRNGGRIVSGRGTLLADQYGRPLKYAFPTEKSVSLAPEVLEEQIQRTVLPLPVRLTTGHKDGNEGIFFRMVPAGDGSWLVNLVNYNFEPRKVELSGDGTFRDLIREAEFTPALELPTLSPLLLRFQPRDPKAQ